nr:MAG TPA: hypothetical protein [Caudoviricetes sp.]
MLTKIKKTLECYLNLLFLVETLSSTISLLHLHFFAN